MNKDNNTQKNDNLCKRGIEVSEYENAGLKMKYTGEIVIVPLEYESRRNKKIESLEKQVANLQTDKELWEKRAKDMRDRFKEEQKVSEQLKADNEKLSALIVQFQQRLEKFNGKGRNTKLTPEVQQFIQACYMQKLSVVKIFNDLVAQGWDISYETVRRYVSSLKKPKNT